MTMKKHIIYFFAFLFTFTSYSCKNRKTHHINTNISISQNLSSLEEAKGTATLEYQDLEIPYLEGDVPRQILRRNAYTSCYNHETRCPNWVAWVLTRESVQGDLEKRIWFDENGNAIGITDFKPEYVKGTYIYDAEAEEPRPQFKDWEQMPTGASHGHMCPVADCKTSKAAINLFY